METYGREKKHTFGYLERFVSNCFSTIWLNKKFLENEKKPQKATHYFLTTYDR